MKLALVPALTISLGLIPAASAFGQAQSNQNSPQQPAGNPPGAQQIQAQFNQNSPQQPAGNPPGAQQIQAQSNQNSPQQPAGNPPGAQQMLGQPSTTNTNYSWIYSGVANQPGPLQWWGFPQWNVDTLYQPYVGAWNHDSRVAGVTLASADDALRAHLKLPKDQGLVVTGLGPVAPQADIQLNDVLLKLGDTPLNQPEDFVKHVKSAGDAPVTLLLLRLGKPKEVSIQPVLQVAIRPAPQPAPETKYWIGISVTSLDPALRSQLQLPAGQGLIVNEVVKDSPASKADIKVNDILFEIDGKPMSDSAKLVDVVQAHAEKPMSLHFIREGKRHWSVEVTPERRKASEGNGIPTQQLYNALILTRPGGVVADLVDPKSPYQSGLQFYSTIPNDNATLTPNNQAEPKQSADAGAGVSKRLDTLDADIKQLRQAIEELSRATKDKK